MARGEELLIESVGDETVIYDIKSKEAHCLKALAAVVFALADGSNTTADIAELAAYRLGQPVTEAEVVDAVAQLEQHALLDTPLVIRDGISRREALGRMAATGIGATVGVSMITTVMAPTALAAGSQIATGNCCGSTLNNDACTGQNPHCQSGHCCANQPGQSCNQCKCVGDKNDCDTGQCNGAPGTCAPITINNVTFNACGTTSSGKCCYEFTTGAPCCPVVATGGGAVVNC